MFKNHKLEVKLVKDSKVETAEATPSITKEEIIATSKTILKYAIGGALVILAASAVKDVATYNAMTRIDNRYQKELED
jgi:hypothetical protein